MTRHLEKSCIEMYRIVIVKRIEIKFVIVFAKRNILFTKHSKYDQIVPRITNNTFNEWNIPPFEVSYR